MSAATLDSPLQFAGQPRRALRSVADPATSYEEAAAANADIQLVHSELVLVCPELRRRLLELLPERDPDAFPARPQRPILLAAPDAAADELAARPVDLLLYTLLRLGQLAKSGLTIVAAVFTLAIVAEILAR
jgi:hypothetical protein